MKLTTKEHNMSKSNYLIASAAALVLSAGAAMAQPMNHSGSNVPDGTDRSLNQESGMSVDQSQPDTRDSLRKKENYGARQESGLDSNPNSGAAVTTGTRSRAYEDDPR
jgi:hypothetical protein